MRGVTPPDWPEPVVHQGPRKGQRQEGTPAEEFPQARPVFRHRGAAYLTPDTSQFSKHRKMQRGWVRGGGCSSDILPRARTVGLKVLPGRDSRRKGAGAGRQLPCSTGQDDAVGPRWGSEDSALSPQDQGPALVGVRVPGLVGRQLPYSRHASLPGLRLLQEEIGLKDKQSLEQPAAAPPPTTPPNGAFKQNPMRLFIKGQIAGRCTTSRGWRKGRSQSPARGLQ